MLSAVIGFIGAVLLAVTGWAFNMNSRISVLEADKEESRRREANLKELIDVKLENIMVMITAGNLRLDRIERKLDREE
jgi:hypothetical protein